MTNASWDSSELAACPEIDTLEMVRLADRADWILLRMVSCVACATLLLAAAGSVLG